MPQQRIQLSLLHQPAMWTPVPHILSDSLGDILQFLSAVSGSRGRPVPHPPRILSNMRDCTHSVHRATVSCYRPVQLRRGRRPHSPNPTRRDDAMHRFSQVIAFTHTGHLHYCTPPHPTHTDIYMLIFKLIYTTTLSNRYRHRRLRS